ncbi:MAG: cache domain-containing protein [Chloroflexota bacterium]
MDRFGILATLRSNLGRRIVLLVALSMLIIILAMVVSGWLAVRQSSSLVSHERQSLAQATGKYLDYILQQNLARLDGIRFATGVDLEDANLEPEKRAIHSIYLGSIFDQGVFLTDRAGTVLWVEPSRPDFIGTDISGYPPVRQGLDSGKPVVSDVFPFGPDRQPAVLMVTPVRNGEGKIVGLIGGQINPLNRTLNEFTRTAAPDENSYIDIIDSHGVLLASSDPRRLASGSGENLRSGDDELAAMTPLVTTPWSVVVRQPTQEALAPIRAMEFSFIIFGLSSLVLALFLSWGMARSLVKPITQLTAAARGISRGDLSQPVPHLSNDEIGQLSRSFDTMRIALKKSLEEIQQWNRELEAKVEERTRQLEASYREIESKETARGELLRKVLSVQEEERRRIARELHDETTQALVALVMRLEAALAIPDDAAGKIKERLTDAKNLAVRAIDNVHQIIFDLRPSVLDDLGLPSAIRWYAENRLGAAGTKTRLEITGEERQLPPQVETALFRVVQEAITNIIKHSRAHSVVISLEFKPAAIAIEIEDDGQGFNVAAVSPRPDKVQGLGLLGMQERVTLLGGSFHLESEPSGGTTLSIEVPLTQ